MRRFTQTLLATSLMALPLYTYAATAADVSPAERSKIESVVHDYLLKNPEILMQSIQVLQQKQYEKTAETVKETQKMASSFAPALFQQANDPVAGNPNGTITVVEFFDYQCPHCVDMAPVIDAVVKANPDVRVVYKEFPIRGPMSELAARAALAANMQGKYAALSHAMLKATQPLSQDSILKYAKENGLDVEKLKTDMKSSTVDNQIKANLKLAQELKLFGTPALFVGKTNAKGSDSIAYLPGQVPLKKLQETIDKTK